MFRYPGHKLNEQIVAEAKRALERAEGRILSQVRWKGTDHDTGLREVVFADAVHWIFRNLYFVGKINAATATAIAFLETKFSPNVDTRSARSGARWLTTAEYCLAAGAFQWLMSGSFDAGWARRTLECLDEWGRISELMPREVIAANSQTEAESIYSRPFLCNALLGNWKWIKSRFDDGWSSHVGRQRRSGDAVIIYFSYALASSVQDRQSSREAELSLRVAVDSWTRCALARQHWGPPLTYLYFAVACFDYHTCRVWPTVFNVNERLAAADPGRA